MTLISVLTPCTRVESLAELAGTVLGQAGVELEWIVQLDGAAREREDEVRALLPRDERVRVEANPQPAGSGTTRNLALLRARGQRVLCVDDDDLLAPGGLARLAAALDEHPECFAAWGASHVFTDDVTAAEPFKTWPAEGVIDPGVIMRRFQESGEFDVHVGACLWRRDHLEAVGGYAALLRSIDTNPFIACQRRHPLVYVDVPVYLYRQHAGQMTRSDHYRELRERTHAFTFRRADHLADLW
jgi:glycosyltransferase involved in cell wall biosynthesis